MIIVDEITKLIYLFFAFQEPRPLSQLDLEKALATSQKTTVAANEYDRMNQQSSSRRPFPGENDYDVQAAIKEISKLMGSHMINLQLDSQDA